MRYYRRIEALLLIAIFVGSSSYGFVACASHSVDSHKGTYEFVPPMPQYTSQSPSLNFTIPYPVPRPSPIVGQMNVLIVAVEFTDITHTLSIENAANNTLGQLDRYYKQVSYGKTSIVGKIVGWIKLPYRMVDYGADNGPFVDDQDSDGYPDSWRLLRDALPSVMNEVDLAQFQQVVVLHSGYGQESSRVQEDIWSVTYMQWTLGAGYTSIEKFSIVPEFEARGLGTIGVYTHEFGHLLGLPDLYNNVAEQVGPWDLMARGAWNGNPPGSTPSEMIAWNRIFLGWITPDHVINVTTPRRVNATVNPIESPSTGIHAIRVQAPSQDSQHYYLVEVRQKIGFDVALPSSGVLITYIDETKSELAKVIDALQTSATLDDAPFQVGQTYSDVQNSLTISVTGAIGASFTIVVDTSTPSPDVAVESLTMNPPTVRPNATATVLVKVTNQGILKADGFFVDIFLNETVFASRKLSLDPSQSQEIQLTWTPKIGGVYVFKVIADSQKTIPDNNRENNIKTLRVTIGYTLTLELRPPGAGADIEWWIILNGNNQTMAGVGEFQIGVVPGPNTLQIQPSIYLNPNSRYIFRQWSDGSTLNPRAIQVSSDTTLVANFDAQYLLSLEPNGGTVGGSGWYNSGSPATVTATSPSNVVANQSRLTFMSWSGGVQSSTPTVTVTMTHPYNLTANWKRQFYLNVQSAYTLAGGGWYDANSQAVVSLSSPVTEGNGIRYVFVRWGGDLSGADRTQSITMSGPKLVAALWAPQYELKLASEYGHVNGAGWYDPAVQAIFGVDITVIDLANDTRRVFTQWSADASGNSQLGTVAMDGPRSIQANWKTQYLVTFATSGVRNDTTLTITLNEESHEVKVPAAVGAWVDAGSSVAFSSNATASVSYRRYNFQDWTNSTGGIINSPQTVNKPEKYTAVYKELSMFPCIIATVTFGSEATPEVQFLRNFRDHLVLSTRAGSAFMSAFNLWYYSFSPQVADFIVRHDVMRNPLMIVFYPLLGILELSSIAYSTLAFAPELAITMAGLLASALIGIVYLTPIDFFLVRLLRSKKIRATQVFRAYSISILVATALLVVSELSGSFTLLAVTASALVLSTIVAIPLLLSFELTKMENHLKLLAKMKAALRFR